MIDFDRHMNNQYFFPIDMIKQVDFVVFKCTFFKGSDFGTLQLDFGRVPKSISLINYRVYA